MVLVDIYSRSFKRIEKKGKLSFSRILPGVIVSANVKQEITRIRCAYGHSTQFNFKLYILNKLDSSSAVKAYKSTSCMHILSLKREEHNKTRVQNEETALV